MSNEIEQLTDEDRAQVRMDEYEGQTLTPKLVRIIDAHAAGVAALVAQLEAANGLLHRALDKDPMVRRDIRVFFKQPGIVPPAHAALVAQLEDLKEERDALTRAHAALVALLEAAGHNHAALVAEVTRLTRERNEARALAKQFEAEAERRGHMATRNLAGADEEYVRANAAAREVTRLTEALAAAERRTRTELARVDAAEARVTALTCEKAALRGQLDGAEARVRELEAEVKAERDSVREFSRKTREAESECAALRAEVARLKAGPTPDWVEVLDREVGGRMAAESRLAAANALLLTVYSQEYIDTHLAAQPAMASDPTGLAEAMNQALLGQPQHVTRAILAAQPATARADAHAPCPELDGRTPREMMLSGYAQPATAPARDEAEQDPADRVLSWAGPAARADLKEARTEADAVPTAHLEFLRGRGNVLQSNLAAAELARRGRKPNQ